MPTGVIPNYIYDDGEGPDVEGFRDAQAKLVEVLGEDVTFIHFEDKVWAPDVQLDPETNEPYDPTTQPVSGGGEVAVTLRVTPIEGGQNDEDETLVGPSGLRDINEPVFIVNSGDAPLIEDSVYVDHNGERYHITDIKEDDDRYLVFTEPT
jgi:hypothetical protein